MTPEPKAIVLVSYPFGKKIYRGAVRTFQGDTRTTHLCDHCRVDRAVALREARELLAHLRTHEKI